MGTGWVEGLSFLLEEQPIILQMWFFVLSERLRSREHTFTHLSWYLTLIAPPHFSVVLNLTFSVEIVKHLEKIALKIRNFRNHTKQKAVSFRRYRKQLAHNMCTCYFPILLFMKNPNNCYYGVWWSWWVSFLNFG